MKQEDASWSTIQYGCGPNCNWSNEDGHLELQYNGQAPIITIQVCNSSWVGKERLGFGTINVEELLTGGNDNLRI